MLKALRRAPPAPLVSRKAWKLMSELTRRKGAGHDENVSCVTCGAYRHWTEMHAGHFVHCSKQSPLSYDERNIHSQCAKCNTYNHGSLIEYTLYITEKYGCDTIDELKSIKHSGIYLKRAELMALIEDLETKIRQLSAC